jgi:hypothetical protein
MTLVFALVTYLGLNIVDTSYFRSIDDCIYYATRINDQVGVPNGSEGAFTYYKATCKPIKVDAEKTTIY